MSKRLGGFALLEAIVAMVLISTTGLALFSWINTNLTTAVRLRDSDAAARLKIAAVEAVSSINPAQRPDGTIEVGSVSISWHAVPAGQSTIGATYGETGQGAFRMQLYDVAVNAKDARTEGACAFHVTSLAYKRLFAYEGY